MGAKHALFDLDGTLVDTAPDLADALNGTRANHGLPPLPFEAIRPTVSLGGAAMIQAGFGVAEADAGFIPLRDEFLALYRDGVARRSRLFPGMEQVLARLEENGVPWGIVTNKSGWLTTPLAQALGLAARARCIVSGDTVEQPKPHPAPLLHACKLLGCAPPEALYVGDAKRDMEAGRRAGMTTIVAAYGYIEAGENPADWQADGLIRHPAELLDWFGGDAEGAAPRGG